MAQTDLGVIKPVNKGAWIKANTYEELNMVLDSGKMYMANKAVPADTEISDTEYWVNMSGTGITETQLQAWAKSIISTSNLILTEVEEANILQAISDLSSTVSKNTTDISAKIEVDDYAQEKIGGTIKLRLVGETAYITNNGTNP